jgi:hypothetical protein
MKRSFGPRKAADLSESTQRHLNMYAVAASAAGVGILAWAQRAEAKIVYTRVNKPLGFGLTILDLNNDGMPDFGFCENAFGSSRSTTCTLTLHQRQPPLREHHPPSPFSRVLYMIPPAASNQRNQIFGGTLGASALPAGAPVGPKSKFTLAAKKWLSALRPRRQHVEVCGSMPSTATSG